ncbi:MAG: hypothetical protein A2W80_13815 [Candidatus Riflebacteria bacterium GWC2_50_8]|nr:MAG: hypothetical protein A2W80_13815 [Candidatus Riflebacteria bacterium GWC2_50_8]
MLGTIEIFVVAYIAILLVLMVIAYAGLKAAFTLTAGLNEVIKGLAAIESRLARIEEKQE